MKPFLWSHYASDLFQQAFINLYYFNCCVLTTQQCLRWCWIFGKCFIHVVPENSLVTVQLDILTPIWVNLCILVSSESSVKVKLYPVTRRLDLEAKLMFSMKIQNHGTVTKSRWMNILLLMRKTMVRNHLHCCHWRKERCTRSSLRKLAENCEFKENLNEQLRDKFVCG